MVGSWDRLGYSLKPRNYFIRTTRGAASQGVPRAAQPCAGWCPSPAGIQGKPQDLRGKAGFSPAPQMPSLTSGDPALRDSGAAAEPGPGAAVPTHAPPSSGRGRLLSPAPCPAVPLQTILGRGVGRGAHQHRIVPSKIKAASRDLRVYVSMCPRPHLRKTKTFVHVGLRAVLFF